MLRQVLSRCAIFLLLAVAGSAYGGSATWTHLWQGFQSRFMDSQGRVVDWREDGITTSEGESYALFFSLIADDRVQFNRILNWTQNHLAQGNLAVHLPAWKWGRSQNGHWQILGKASASDADLWLAYTLLSAAHLWHDDRYQPVCAGVPVLQGGEG